MLIGKELNERLANFIRLDVRTILGSTELRKEYIELHFIIEGFKPTCTGCSAKSRLASWKKKYAKAGVKIIKKKQENMLNTFKLKKGRLRLSIPFSGSVITDSSSDELVLFYLNNPNINEQEKQRRASFFEVLPIDKKEVIEFDSLELEQARKDYLEKFDKEVSNRYKNNLDWINKRLSE